MGLTAIVLAAGSSSRLGRAKQSLVIDGETLLDRAVRIANEVAEETIVVTASPVAVAARVVINAVPEEGMASSLRCGVDSASPHSRVLFLLVDQPRITIEHLRALAASNAPIVATGYAGIAGVPAIFAPSYRQELLELRGDRGARAIIERNREVVDVIVFEGAAVDVDSEEDLPLIR